MNLPLKPLPIALLVDEAPAVPKREPAPPAPPSPDLALRQRRLERWFRDHFDMLWCLAARLGVPAAHVDDVVQEAFITADRRAAEIAHGSERGFLIGSVVRLSANQRRRQKTLATHTADLARQPDPFGPADAEHLLAQKQRRELLELALGELPSEQRSVLVLFEIEGFSAAEIAELLELPPGTVASRLSRARTKFSKAAARLRARWHEPR